MRLASLTRADARPIDSSATMSAGVLAGAAFLAVLVLFTPEPWWMPPQREASLFVAGPAALKTFSFSLFMIGIIVHLAWSVLLASAIDEGVRRLALLPAIAAGAVLGAALYFIDAAIAIAWAPWVAPAKGLTMFFAHVVYGMVAAGAYEGIEEQHARRRAAEEVAEDRL